jgi:hypothetical protein
LGNYFRPGPDTQAGPFEILISPGEGIPQIYVEGNLGPHRPDTAMDEWSIVGYGWGEEGVAPETYRTRTPFPVPLVTATSAEVAYEQVLDGAGATAPQRDAVDRRVVGEVRNGTGAIIDSLEQVGGYPELEPDQPPADSDHDGMPDNWEMQQGLDPNDPSDGNGDLDGDGYTNGEEYLHALAR